MIYLGQKEDFILEKIIFFREINNNNKMLATSKLVPQMFQENERDTSAPYMWKFGTNETFGTFVSTERFLQMFQKTEI